VVGGRALRYEAPESGQGFAPPWRLLPILRPAGALAQSSGTDMAGFPAGGFVPGAEVAPGSGP